jgi:hypothetical protein
MITKKKINIPIDWGTDAEEFKHYVGRYPKNLEELKSWAYKISQGVQSQVDWDMVCEIASEEFKK